MLEEWVLCSSAWTNTEPCPWESRGLGSSPGWALSAWATAPQESPWGPGGQRAAQESPWGWQDLAL